MTGTTNERTRSGGPATITLHHSVVGIIGMPFDDSIPVRNFTVGEVRPYAQYERTVYITYTLPRKRNRTSIHVRKDGLTYVTIDAGGQTIYDSRDDRSELDRVPVHIVHFKTRSIEVPRAQGNRPFRVQRIRPAQPWRPLCADVVSEELEYHAIVRLNSE